jgi:hypothetical protein
MPYDYAYGKHDHHKGVFFLTTLVVTGLCSVFPILCFKHYSGVERRKKQEAEARARKLQKKNDRVSQQLAPRHARARSHSPRTARAPHHNRPRRHSTVKLRDTHDFRGRRFRAEDEDELEDELESIESDQRHQSRAHRLNDRQLDRER